MQISSEIWPHNQGNTEERHVISSNIMLSIKVNICASREMLVSNLHFLYLIQILFISWTLTTFTQTMTVFYGNSSSTSYLVSSQHCMKCWRYVVLDWILWNTTERWKIGGNVRGNGCGLFWNTSEFSWKDKEIMERTVGDCMFFKTSPTNITLTLKEES